MTERGLETPEDDALERAAAADPEDDGAPPDHEHDSLEVDPADRADQDREIALDDDEYR
jgi:hypothetical protein